MAEYRFCLDPSRPRNKVACPVCQRKNCFVRYIDCQGTVNFPEYVGRCDHEYSCGFHYKPADYFKNFPEARPIKDDVYCVPFAKTERSKTPSFMDYNLMLNTLKRYETNPLHQWFSRIVGEEEATRIFKEYHVGTSKKWGGSTVFWQTDYDDRVRGGKIIGYNQFDGKRIKGDYPQVSWVHTTMDYEDFNLIQCLFGEHLIKTRPEDAIAIVESEKTAIICSHFLSKYIWIATGGKNGCFNSQAMSVLKNRKVILVPDLGCEKFWVEKGSQMLTNITSEWMTYLRLPQIATEEQIKAGNDIADIILNDLNNIAKLDFESTDIKGEKDLLKSYDNIKYGQTSETLGKDKLDVIKMVDFKTNPYGNLYAQLKDEYRECDSSLSDLDTLSSLSTPEVFFEKTENGLKRKDLLSSQPTLFDYDSLEEI